jgi:GWxTD domain-containing protein
MTSLCVALLLGIPILGGDPEPIPSFPVEATGDIHFQFDASRFLQDSTQVFELYLSIPQDELLAVATDEGDSVFQVELRFDFMDPNGDHIIGRAGHQQLPVLERVDEKGLPPAHTLTLRPEIPPQTAYIKASVTDPNASKRGLLYLIRGTKKSGEAQAKFRPSPPPQRGGLSDILYVWSVSAPEEEEDFGVDLSESGLPVRSRILPNPSHFYGLYHRDLAFYFEVYPEDMAAEDSCHLLFEIERVRDSTIVRRGTEQVEARGHVVPVYRRFDIQNLDGGTYLLHVRWLEGLGGDVQAERMSPFQVLWDSPTWYLSEKELLEDASILLSDEQYREFVLLDRGNQERYMERFWDEHDPSPESPQNEARAEFERRKAYVRRNFTSYRKGKLTDRGKVYIRFGQPDEIEKELNPQDQDVVQNVIDREFSEEEQQFGARRDFMTIDNRAWEVWYYHLYGDPLLPEYVGPQVRREMKFIFLDQMGYGDYTLIYTNVFGGFR